MPSLLREDTVQSDIRPRVGRENVMRREESLRAQLAEAEKRITVFTRAQTGLIALCWVFPALALLARFVYGSFWGMVGCGVCAVLCGVGSWLPGSMARPYHALAFRLRQDLKALETPEPQPEAEPWNPAGIPVTVGFANLFEEDFAALARQDADALTPLFARSRFAADYMTMPQSDVLFVYARLDENGAIHAPVAFGVRQLEQLSRARLIILASPNPPDRIKRAIELPGPKTANRIFTVERRGEHFAPFFHKLFERMRAGADLVAAWAEFASENVEESMATAEEIPVTILWAEAGRLGFE